MKVSGIWIDSLGVRNLVNILPFIADGFEVSLNIDLLYSENPSMIQKYICHTLLLLSKQSYVGIWLSAAMALDTPEGS